MKTGAQLQDYWIKTSSVGLLPKQTGPSVLVCLSSQEAALGLATQAVGKAALNSVAESKI